MLAPEDFEWDQYRWKSRVELPEWRGYLAQSFLYRDLGGQERSDGTVDVAERSLRGLARWSSRVAVA